MAVYSMRVEVRLDAGLSILTTIFVCIVLAFGSGIFSKMMVDLVIAPIEAMITKVQNIEKNPLKAAHDEE